MSARPSEQLQGSAWVVVEAVPERNCGHDVRMTAGLGGGRERFEFFDFVAGLGGPGQNRADDAGDDQSQEKNGTERALCR